MFHYTTKFNRLSWLGIYSFGPKGGYIEATVGFRRLE